MSLSDAQDTIAQGWRELVDCWERSGLVWRDAARLAFQREHWDAYEPAVQRSLDALATLDREVQQMYRDLSD